MLGDRDQASFFYKFQNVLDKDPPLVSVVGGLLYADKPTKPQLFDVMGRAYRASVRFRI